MINENSTREEVLEVVKQNGWDLEYASDELKADRDVVLEAIRQNYDAFYYASDELQIEIVIVGLKAWRKK